MRRSATRWRFEHPPLLLRIQQQTHERCSQPFTAAFLFSYWPISGIAIAAGNRQRVQEYDSQPGPAFSLLLFTACFSGVGVYAFASGKESIAWKWGNQGCTQAMIPVRCCCGSMFLCELGYYRRTFSGLFLWTGSGFWVFLWSFVFPSVCYGRRCW